ncbi:MAG: hypothetical protein JNK77_15465 [Saprospiraceae bacterium]|nr:hypothetical protein [Saprospiraceae bacterium]
MQNFLTTAFLSWLLTYAAGWLLWLPFSGQRKLEGASVFFFKMALGWIGLTTLSALYYTGGITIMSGAVVLYAWAWLTNRRERQPVQFSLEWREGLAGVFILFSTIGVQFIRNQYFDPDFTWLSYCDYGVYATMIEYLPKAGVEVSWPWYELFDVSARGLVQPYHYADSWYAVAINTWSGGENALAIYIYCFIPVLVSIGFSGLSALCRVAARRSGPLAWPELAVAFFGVFIHGCLAPAFKFLHAHSLNILTSPKIALLSIPLAMIWILWLRGLRPYAILVAAFIPLANVLYAPVVLPAFFIMAIFFKSRLAVNANPTTRLVVNANPTTSISGVFALLFSALFIVAFYYFLGNFDTSSDPTTLREGHSYAYWFLRRMTATPVRHLISYFPLYLVFGLLFYKRKKLLAREWEVGVSAILLLFFSTLTAALMNNFSEGFQFHILTYNPVSQLGIVLGVGLLLYYNWAGWWKRLALGLAAIQAIVAFAVLFTSFHQRDSAVDKTFAAKVSILLKNKNPIGVYFQNPLLITTYSADPRMCYICNLLKATGPGRWANDLAVHEDLDQLSFPERKTAIANSPFYRFLDKQKKSGEYAGYAAAQLAFVDRYGVDYVLVENGTTAPRGILSCTDTLLVEPYSGTQLLILKRPCVSSSSQPPTTPR